MTLLLNIALVAAARDRAGGNRLLGNPVPPASPRLVVAHGCVAMQEPFLVPANTPIVTFSAYGESLNGFAGSEAVMEILHEFYRQKNTLYQGNDTSEVMTQAGEDFVSQIQAMTNGTFQPNIHLPGRPMNNLHLDFTPQHGINGEKLGVMEVKNGNVIQKKEGQTDLETFAEENHGRTIFVFACRADDHIPKGPQGLMRELSRATDTDQKNDIGLKIRGSLRVCKEEKENRARYEMENRARYEIGLKVKIVGLTNSKQYNGKQAEVINYNEERVQVRLLQGGKILSVKHENLMMGCGVHI